MHSETIVKIYGISQIEDSLMVNRKTFKLCLVMELMDDRSMHYGKNVAIVHYCVTLFSIASIGPENQ
jgi:hypothetical protein